MGLTANSTGLHSIDNGLQIDKSQGERVVALAGNPNVGKSTVFNGLTGLNQHTGNWPGKTVSNATGTCRFYDTDYIMVDIPGTYSLMAHSAEEEVARDFICFGDPDAVIVVCDATCLERNLNLVLQTIEITPNVVVCVNLMDEAKKKKIKIDLKRLEEALGVPVVGTSARNGHFDELMRAVTDTVQNTQKHTPIKIRYIREIEAAIDIVAPALEEKLADKNLPLRWAALKLIDNDPSLVSSLNQYLDRDITKDTEISVKIDEARAYLSEQGIGEDELRDKIVFCLVITAEGICNDVVFCSPTCNERDRKIDRILTNKWTGFPIMLLMLAFIFWLTITGANYPSELISGALFQVQDWLVALFQSWGAPEWLTGALILGVYRVLAWVVSVMLPPMAIFFPIFTLLEDLGYLPRVAFNLDKYFKKCHACGKQALTMCIVFIIL